MRTMLVASTLAISLSYLGLAAAPSLGAAYAIAVLGGLGNGIQWVSVVTAVQELTEQGMQARVLGLLEATATALPGIGFFAGGALAALASPRAVYLAASAGGLIVLAVSAVKLRTAVWPDRPAVSADEVALPGHGPVADWD
jgi:MFS family permease